MMDKPVEILFDCDDILIDTVPRWLDEINSKYGIRKHITDVTDWDITKPFSKEILEGKITKEDIYAVVADDNFWRDISRIEHMYPLLDELKSQYGDKIKMSILTASHYYTLRSKMTRVLYLYKGIFEWDDVIVTSRKGMVRGDILVDDNFDNCNEFINNNRFATAIMRERPYSINKYMDTIKPYNSILVFKKFEELDNLIKTNINYRFRG